MLSFGFRRVAAFVVALLVLQLGTAAASPTPLEGEAKGELVTRATPAAPHWVLYSDKFVSGTTGPPATSAITGFNTFLLSFWLTEGAWDKAQEWTTLTAAQRATVKSQYAAAGIKLLVSAFGSTDTPTSSGNDPVGTANSIAAWVKQYNLDGVDVDYEDFNAMNGGTAENWLISFTRQLRSQLPAGDYIITHAPVAPWFTPNRYPGGGYLKVHQQVGSLIDWYNVQFYNQGASEYTTCAGLLTSSSSAVPNSAVFQIIASGVPANKVVIGKPANTGDASSGYMAPATLAGCVAQAKSQGWTSGVSTWEYPDAAASWIQTVRSSSWPV
ncbi:glycoside hydrolase family 18 protein [Trametes elegans]|nr:glycoside hydrolase family 18 protein [Trametes elegans]